MSILDDMNFRALDENFVAISLVDDYDSIIWTDRYGDIGDFEIHGQINTQLLAIALNASYILNSVTYTLMVVEKIKIDFSEDAGNTITISGRSFESFLDRRVMLENVTIFNPTVISSVPNRLVTYPEAYIRLNPNTNSRVEVTVHEGDPLTAIPGGTDLWAKTTLGYILRSHITTIPNSVEVVSDPRISQIICDLVSTAFGNTDPRRYWDKLEVINETSSLIAPTPNRIVTYPEAYVRLNPNVNSRVVLTVHEGDTLTAIPGGTELWAKTKLGYILRSRITEITTPVEVIPDPGISYTATLKPDVGLQFTMGDNLLPVVMGLSVGAGLGFKCRFSPDDKKMQFIVYEGIDRTIQGEDLVVFSDLYDNLLTASDETSFDMIKNTMLTLGNKVRHDNQEPMLPIIIGDAQWTGLSRRETFYKTNQEDTVFVSKDVQRPMTNAEYIAALTLLGTAELNSAAYQTFKNFNGEIIETSSCKYGTNFNLGDVVAFRMFQEENVAARIDGITFSDDSETGKSLVPIFTYGI